MTAKEQKEWSAEKRNLSSMATSICGRTIPVRDVEMDAVAYTDAKGTIYLSYDNDLYKGLTKDEKVVIRCGICTHEVLHQVKTDFKAMESMFKTIPKYEREIYAEINNIMEDCAIETQANDTVGGFALESLDFAIAHTYKTSHKIEEFEHPFLQFINALVQFGDMGLPKGHFTFPEAKKVFLEVAPIFSECIEEPNGKKRCQLSKQVFDISKPLWENVVKEKEAYEKLLKALKEYMKENGITETKGSGSGSGSGLGSGDREKTEKKKKRQKLTVKIISEEEKKKMMEEMSSKSSGEAGESGGGGGTGTAIMSDGKGSGCSGDFDEMTLLMTEEDLKKQMERKEEKDGESSGSGVGIGNEEESKNKEEKGESGTGDSNNESKESKEEFNSDSGNKKGDTEENKARESSSKSSNSRSSEEKATSGSTVDVSSENSDCDSVSLNDDADLLEIGDEEYDLDESVAKGILQDIEETIKEMSKEIEAKDDSIDFDLDINITSARFSGVSCVNKKITASATSSLADAYGMLQTEMSGGIKTLVNHFRRIFQNDAEEIVYKNSGKTDIARMYNGKVTARVFDKRRAPADKNDLAVFLLIDESGSMYGNKEKMARNTAISFAEAFGKLNIPLYVMGFTADCERAGAVHNHYISWNNNATTRLRLMNIAARSNNFDGYSIRYATEILKKKNAKHKLLLIISDGYPACNSYKSTKLGIEDTKDAIKCAKKYASVLGVGIGDVTTDIFTHMYGNDFLHIAKIDNLYSGISKKLVSLVKGWD